MPMRASKKDFGSHVGKMIFSAESKRTIERRLNKADQGNLRESLKRRGVGEIKNEDIVKVMAGEHRAGWSQYKMRRVVEALQDVGVARKARSASQMVTQASRDAQLESKDSMKKLACERRKEANTEELESTDRTGVLDRMRGAIGVANKAGSGGATSQTDVDTGGRTNPFDRKQMKLQSKLRIPKETKEDDENPYAGFQA